MRTERWYLVTLRRGGTCRVRAFTPHAAVQQVELHFWDRIRGIPSLRSVVVDDNQSGGDDG